MAKKPRKAKKEVTAKRTMKFEHVKRSYEDTAKRLVDAVAELNAAMREAYERDDMHVFCGPEKDEFPMCLGYKICRVTHERFTMKMKIAEKQEEVEREATVLASTWRASVARGELDKA